MIDETHKLGYGRLVISVARRLLATAAIGAWFGFVAVAFTSSLGLWAFCRWHDVDVLSTTSWDHVALGLYPGCLIGVGMTLLNALCHCWFRNKFRIYLVLISAIAIVILPGYSSLILELPFYFFVSLLPAAGMVYLPDWMAGSWTMGKRE